MLTLINTIGSHFAHSSRKVNTPMHNQQKPFKPLSFKSDSFEKENTETGRIIRAKHIAEDHCNSLYKAFPIISNIIDKEMAMAIFDESSCFDTENINPDRIRKEDNGSVEKTYVDNKLRFVKENYSVQYRSSIGYLPKEISIYDENEVLKEKRFFRLYWSCYPYPESHMNKKEVYYPDGKTIKYKVNSEYHVKSPTAEYQVTKFKENNKPEFKAAMNYLYLYAEKVDIEFYKENGTDIESQMTLKKKPF